MLKWSLRQQPAEFLRLARSFGLSVAAHLLVFLLWLLLVTGEKHHWWDPIHMPKWLQTPKMLTQVLLPKKAPAPPPPPQEPPLVFVEVNPAAATPEPPKNAKFYSDRNSLAANPNADQETGVPKIDGTQEQVVRTEDVSRPNFSRLQPAPAPVIEPPPKPTEPEPKKPVKPAPQEVAKTPPPKPVDVQPQPAPPPGDLAFAKPQPKLQPLVEPQPEIKPGETEAQAPRSRPRTIQEALARQQPNQIPGQKMKQDGGVRRHLDFSSLDAKATPFGAYDRALVDAICQRWYALLDQRGYASDDRGKVVVSFVLHPDGRVSDMKVSNNTAGDLLGYLCQQAIQEPAPFAPWPSDMRRMVGETRPIQFTFYYN